MKTIVINGKTFELSGETSRNYVKDRDLFDCYARPSVYKIRIWDDWMVWFNEAHISDYGVSSYNSSFFSINAIARDVDGKDYMLVITHAHDRAYEIV